MKLIKLINLKSNKTISLREIFLLASAFLIIPKKQSSKTILLDYHEKIFAHDLALKMVVC